MQSIELKGYSSRFSLGNKIGRMVWRFVSLCLFRPTPIAMHGWRALLLRLFGAKIDGGVFIYPDAKIWAPWNLVMEAGATLGPEVDCYNVSLVKLGEWCVVSQRAFLCTASHDINSKSFELTHAPIVIGTKAWVAAEAFVGPGVTIGQGAVVGARACITKSVPAWQVYAGNPAKRIGKRKFSKRG